MGSYPAGSQSLPVAGDSGAQVLADFVSCLQVSTVHARVRSHGQLEKTHDKVPGSAV